MLIFVAATFTVTRLSDFKIGREDSDAAEEVMHLVPVRGDLQNTRLFMAGCVCGEGSSVSNRDWDMKTFRAEVAHPSQEIARVCASLCVCVLT